MHFKGYLYERNSNDYIDIDVINKMGLEKPFPTLDDYKNYDLFGLFGNSFRSRFPMLDNLRFGFPHYIKKDPNDIPNYSHWYGTYSILIDMIYMLKKYKKKMLEGNIFLLNNDEEIAERYKQIYYSVSKYTDMNPVECLSISIDDILNRINEFYEISKDPKFNILCDLNGYSFDIDKTVFIFWFNE